jgi:branched-chain amino acid transport system substrate-binding protein
VKKVIFILFTCLTLAAMVLPACGGGGGTGVSFNIPAGTPPENIIKLGIIGPMQYLDGRQHWEGATLAAEHINKDGGVKVGDKTYFFTLIKADSNELNSITDASSAMEKLITVDKAQFVMGGIRTEAVTPMQEIAMDNKTIFLGCGAATASLNSVVKSNYDRYKYWFRVTPFVSAKLVDNTIMEIAMAGAILKEETGIKRPLRVAICAEGAQWADSMVGMMNAWVKSKLHMDVSGTWRPSPNATELTAEMTAIQTANTDIICPITSGPMGIPYGRSWGELKVPAASVGINVEAQGLGYWEATNHFGNFDTGLSSYAQDVAPTALTVPFFNEFVERFKEVPSYTAGTYDAIYILKLALESAGTLDADAVVAALENTATTTTVSPHFAFTGMDAELGNPHDVNYGPGANTGLANQWQDGKLVGVWPNAAYADATVAAGYDPAWKEVNYPGIVKWMPNPTVVDKLKAEAATEPAVVEEEKPVEEQGAAGGLHVPSATYTNDKLGFSFQYPKDWVEDPTLLTTPYHVEDFRVSAFVPVVVASAWDQDAPITAEWFAAAFGKLGVTDYKLKSDVIDDKTADGTPAKRVHVKYTTATGYEALADAIAVDKPGGKRIMLHVYTVDAFDPYVEANHLEILHTLTLAK